MLSNDRGVEAEARGGARLDGQATLRRRIADCKNALPTAGHRGQLGGRRPTQAAGASSLINGEREEQKPSTRRTGSSSKWTRSWRTRRC